VRAMCVHNSHRRSGLISSRIGAGLGHALTGVDD
jgi:hypothetical protein